MTIEKDKWRLTHIIEAIEDIEELMAGIGEDDFSGDYKLQLAIVRLFEIIGEASNNVSAEFKDSHHEVDWRGAIDMRNKMIHGYFEIRISTVWDTICKDIPVLKQQIEKILKEL